MNITKTETGKSRIDFNTGAFYGPDKQPISVVDMGHGIVFMMDHGRGINYFLKCRLDPYSVMGEYIHNRAMKWTEVTEKLGHLYEMELRAEIGEYDDSNEARYDHVFFSNRVDSYR